MITLIYDAELHYVKFSNYIIGVCEVLKNIYEEETGEVFDLHNNAKDIKITIQNTPSHIVDVLNIPKINEWFLTLGDFPSLYIHESIDYRVNLYKVCKYLVADDDLLDYIAQCIIDNIALTSKSSAIEELKTYAEVYELLK
jgi:hypothetical protein